MHPGREHDYLRGILLGLPGVRLGNRFGGEAFFVGKRFFCHFHEGGTLLLETLVWDKVSKVVRAIPGVIPHPQYGAHGWVRLGVSSRADLAKARKLIEKSYQYQICKADFSPKDHFGQGDGQGGREKVSRSQVQDEAFTQEISGSHGDSSPEESCGGQRDSEEGC